MMRGLALIALGIALCGGGWAEEDSGLREIHSILQAQGLISEEAAPDSLFSGVPTCFSYDGTPCWALFNQWQSEAASPERIQGGMQYAAIFTEPGQAFLVRLEVRVFDSPPGVELQWHFENTGSTPSGLVTEVRSIDVSMGAEPGQIVLHSCNGGLTGGLDAANGQTGFQLAHTPLGEKTLTVSNGRSSNGALPFFLLENVKKGRGLAAALGWSGQWRARGMHDAPAGQTRFTAGMEPISFRLPPGERVALPTALFVPFEGSAHEGSNRLRRVLRAHYQGRLNGQPLQPPVSFSSWFVFHNDVNDAMLRELAGEAAPLGIDYFCLDAGWFEGAFPDGVGNWTVDHAKFPEGLKPLADYVHGLGMKFGLWFEPERVTEGTRWCRTHPELILKGGGGPRFIIDLGQDQARDLVFGVMDSMVSEVGVDWIRFDFNTSPLGSWDAVEGDEEKGLRQLQYINGLYAMLEALMRRHPGLLIEQCASGGRRIDLRMVQYGHTFWKSDDTKDQPLMRFHETGANHFLLGGHLNTNYCHYGSEGEILALFAGTLGFGADFRALTGEQKAFIKRAITAYKQVRQFINLDYYPLFEQDTSGKSWNGWQFINPETREGFFVVYRPAGSAQPGAEVPLAGLEPGKTYRLNEMMSDTAKEASGEALMQGMAVDLEPDSAEVWQFVGLE